MPLIGSLTPYQQHVEDWHDCDLCPLSKQRSRIVIARGTVPCEVLFVGEAPGISEDTFGTPFKGPAGQLMDDIIDAALDRREVDYALTNLVCCFPRIAKASGVNEPTEAEIRACQPRLKEFVELCRPRLIVTVGKLAERWVPKATVKIDVDKYPTPKWCSVIHPAAILKANAAQRSLMIQRNVVVLRSALDTLLENRV